MDWAFRSAWACGSERNWRRQAEAVLSVEKRRMVEQTLEAGASVARVAQENGVNANLLFLWGRQHREGRLTDPDASGWRTWRQRELSVWRKAQCLFLSPNRNSAPAAAARSSAVRSSDPDARAPSLPGQCSGPPVGPIQLQRVPHLQADGGGQI